MSATHYIVRSCEALAARFIVAMLHVDAILLGCAPDEAGGTTASAETGSNASIDDAASDHSNPDASMDSASSTGLSLDTTSYSTSTSMESSSTSSENTGALDPVCGNGIVEDDETCDDGNTIPGDGCQECAKDSIVFVSSEYYQGYTLQGLYGADQRCRSLAGKAGLPNHLTYKAWLSTPTTSVVQRLLHSKGRYVLVNGLVVAQNWEALISGVLENPILVDEMSQTKDDAVWTGTFFNGEPALGSEFCDNWEDSGALGHAGVGSSMSVDANWSFFSHGQCGSEARLYCFEQ